jgi:hypothetical protein
LANHVLQLDRLLRASLTAFVADATAAQWQGKERDCVTRFAIGCLFGACGKHHLLEHPTQIGIDLPPLCSRNYVAGQRGVHGLLPLKRTSIASD